MTGAEELKFVGLWLIDIGQSMRDLSAAFQQFCEKLRREAELVHDHAAVARQEISGSRERRIKKSGNSPNLAHSSYFVN